MEQMQHCLECMIIMLMVVIFMSQTEELDHIANVLLRIVVIVMVISKLEYVKDFSCLSMANLKSKHKATVKTTEESFVRDRRSLIFKKTKSLFYNVPCQPQHQEISVYGLDQFLGEISRNPGMSFHDKMKNEWLRLETFSRAPSKLNESAIKLAKDGLYYTGERKICKCAFCGQTFEDWNETDDLTDVHRQISPNCPLILNRLLPSNIAINSEFPLQESEGSRESSHSTVWYPYSEVKYPQYKNFVMRLVSFRGFCTDLTTILSLVKAGFFCTGKFDCVQCFHCGIKLQQWEKNDDPFVEHARFSPGCSYLRETVGQTFVDEVLQLISKSEKECFASSPSNATFRYTEKDQGPKYGAYALFGTRIKSFKGWPSSSVQHPEVLAKAGFYFTGSEDLVRCFFCGGGLKNWEAEDNAWVEHARWFPLCSFVRQKLGDAFVKSVCELHERRCTYGSQSFINEILQATTNPSQTATPDPTSETTSTTATATCSTEVSSSTSTSSTSSPPQATTSNTSSTSTSTASYSSTTVGSESSRSRFDPLCINFEKPRYPAYAVLTVRVNTYDGWPSYLDQTPRAMSLAGFFYAGYGDHTRCFFCGGGLRNWEAGDDPWVEHARWFPKCAFLRRNRGDNFVNMVQKRHQEAESPTLCRSGLEAFDQDRQQSVLNQHPAQMLRKLNVEEHHIKKAVDMYIKQSGDVNFNLKDLLEFIPNSSHLKKAAKSPPFADTEDMGDRDQLRQINEQRKDILRCVCCKQNRVSMVFENCGHNITCAECGEEFDICPKCGTIITTRFKTYLC